MILSTPFSRQNRSHQTWTGGLSNSSTMPALARRPPPPEQQAPQQPRGGPFPQHRSSTLNRLDARPRHQHIDPRSSLRRLPNHHRPEQRPALFNYYGNSGHLTRPSPGPSQIYAPASIASPSESRTTTGYRRPNDLNESQHYAATSYRGAAPNCTNMTASESSRSTRPESALGQLMERFGTLRRRARWTRTSSGNKQSGSQQQTQALMVPLDPEIYANGRREVKAEEIYAEGLQAIDGNSQKRLVEDEIDENIMEEGETKVLLEEQSKRQPDYQNLILALTNWINDELAHQRIIVKDLQDDLYDGQILGKLIEKLHAIDMDMVEVTQNESTQRYKLATVLDTINRILSLQARWAPIRWSVEGIHGKNIVEIIHLLVALALYYRAPIKLPPNVKVTLVVVQKCHGQLMKRSHEAQLTDSHLLVASSVVNPKAPERDAFDALLEFAPDKLDMVKHSLANFCNRHLNKIKMSCSSANSSTLLDPEQFSDGLLLVFLMASLEDYFVPLGNLFTVAPTTTSQPHELVLPTNKPLPDLNNNSQLQTAIEPTSYVNAQPIHKLHNVNIAFQLMEEAGLEVRDKVRPEDIVNGDLKSVLRVLYSLFSRYKHV